jgi:hypothetical protein
MIGISFTCEASTRPSEHGLHSKVKPWRKRIFALKLARARRLTIERAHPRRKETARGEVARRLSLGLPSRDVEQLVDRFATAIDAPAGTHRPRTIRDGGKEVGELGVAALGDQLRHGGASTPGARPSACVRPIRPVVHGVSASDVSLRSRRRTKLRRMNFCDRDRRSWQGLARGSHSRLRPVELVRIVASPRSLPAGPPRARRSRSAEWRWGGRRGRAVAYLDSSNSKAGIPHKIFHAQTPVGPTKGRHPPRQSGWPIIPISPSPT